MVRHVRRPEAQEASSLGSGSSADTGRTLSLRSSDQEIYASHTPLLVTLSWSGACSARGGASFKQDEVSSKEGGVSRLHSV